MTEKKKLMKHFLPVDSKLPLETDEFGVVRVGGTRVTLDVVVGAFKNGATCEEIVFQFPVLDLADVYAVIGFYLKNLQRVEKYLAAQASSAASLRRQVQAKFPVNGLRQRLQKRRSASKTALA